MTKIPPSSDDTVAVPRKWLEQLVEIVSEHYSHVPYVLSDHIYRAKQWLTK